MANSFEARQSTGRGYPVENQHSLGDRATGLSHHSIKHLDDHTFHKLAHSLIDGKVTSNERLHNLLALHKDGRDEIRIRDAAGNQHHFKIRTKEEQGKVSEISLYEVHSSGHKLHSSVNADKLVISGTSRDGKHFVVSNDTTPKEHRIAEHRHESSNIESNYKHKETSQVAQVEKLEDKGHLPKVRVDLGSAEISVQPPRVKIDAGGELGHVWENFVNNLASGNSAVEHSISHFVSGFEHSVSNYAGEVLRTIRSIGTGYYPHDDSMNGGHFDKHGKILYTLQDYLEGKAPYFALAMGPNVPYGTKVRIPELSAKYGRDVIGCVVDTGGAFHGYEKVDVCVRSKQDTTDDTINQPLTLQFLA